jgi:hypothetical protein
MVKQPMSEIRVRDMERLNETLREMLKVMWLMYYELKQIRCCK